MDHILSPGFSIPSIGTPLHQQEADQQIVPNLAYASPIVHGRNHNYGSGSASNFYGSDLNAMGMPTLLNLSTSQAMPSPSIASPYKQMHLGYQHSHQNSSIGMATAVTPQSLMQPQTPVNTFILKYWTNYLRIIFSIV